MGWGSSPHIFFHALVAGFYYFKLILSREKEYLEFSHMAKDIFFHYLKSKAAYDYDVGERVIY